MSALVSRETEVKNGTKGSLRKVGRKSANLMHAKDRAGPHHVARPEGNDLIRI